VLSLPDETFKPNKINVKSSVLYLKRREEADINHDSDHNVIFCDVDSLAMRDRANLSGVSIFLHCLIPFVPVFAVRLKRILELAGTPLMSR